MSNRIAIKDRIKEILLEGGLLVSLGITSSKQIFTNQISDIDEKTLPAVVIYTLNESATLLAQAPIQQYRRTVGVAIDIIIKTKTNTALQDTADTLAHKVESAMLINYRDHNSENPSWNHLIYRSMDANLQDIGDGDFSITRLLFDFVYDTEVDIDDLTDYPTAAVNIIGKVKHKDFLYSIELDAEGDPDEIDLSPDE